MEQEHEKAAASGAANRPAAEHPVDQSPDQYKGAPFIDPNADPNADPNSEVQPKPSVVERLLSPESLQRLMLIGGGLLVAGFLVWLKAWVVFKNPIVVAAAIGAVITALIATGLSLIQYTRYRQAGMGLAFLGTMAMPLQLWFYDAQGLITISAGGHLWIPAALFCVIYAGIARVTRSSLFVYPLVGGILITGMLFLADQSVNQFWNIIPQVTFLVATGWICVFARWLFAQKTETQSAEATQSEDSEFTRQRYGMAFFRAGAAALTAGLALLLAGQMNVWFGWFHATPWLQWQMETPDKIWALVIVAASAVGCGVHVFHARSKHQALALTAALSGWASLVLIDAMNIELTLNMAILTLAATVIATNCAEILRRIGVTSKQPTVGETSKVGSSSHEPSGVSNLTMLGSLVVCGAALIQFGSFEIFESTIFLTASASWMVFQYFLCAVAAATTAWLKVSENLNRVSTSKFAVANFMAVVAGVMVTMTVWTLHGALLWSPLSLFSMVGLLIPMVILLVVVAGRKRSGKSLAVIQPVQSFASAMTGAHLLCVGGALSLDPFAGVSALTIGWSTFSMITLGIASVNYYLAGLRSAPPSRFASAGGMGFHHFLSFVCGTLFVAVALNALGLAADYAVVVTPVLMGGLLMLVGRGNSALANSGRALIAFGNVAMIFFAVGHITGASRAISNQPFVWLTLLHFVAASVAGVFSKQSGWRTAFATLAALLVCCELSFVNDLFGGAWYLKVEALMVLAGAGFLGYGMLGWASETKATERSNSLALWTGSLLTMVPTTLLLLHYRFFAVSTQSMWLYSHEVLTIGIALALCGSGVLCKLRSTTLVGGAGLTIYLLSLLGMIQVPALLNNVAVLMMVGGGLFFAVGILLSVYRDYVISLPNRVRAGKGLFQILKWR